MQKVNHCLWFDTQAEEAVAFYIAAFGSGQVNTTERYGDAGAQVSGMTKGSVMTVSFQLLGQDFIALNGGPAFKFTPAISFMVSFETAVEVDAVWSKLATGGTPLMEIGEYPFSRRYGWIQDKYGLTWQLIYSENRKPQRITPMLLFTGSVCGKTEEAIRQYTSIFSNSKIGDILRYVNNEPPDKEGTVKLAAFTLGGLEFAAMDSAYDHKFTFNEAISFVVNCADQHELDSYWAQLSAHPDSEACGWLKDKYGISWQIVPADLEEMLKGKNYQQTEALQKALYQMKKIDVKALKELKASFLP